MTAAAASVEGKSPATAASSEAALIAQSDAFRALCAREAAAWGDLDAEDPDEGPAVEACRALSKACLDASAALASVPAHTPAGLAVKASALLPLFGPHLDTEFALSEHAGLVVSVLRDAARLGGGAHA